MTPEALLAVIAVCLTVIVCTWLLRHRTPPAVPLDHAADMAHILDTVLERFVQATTVQSESVTRVLAAPAPDLPATASPPEQPLMGSFGSIDGIDLSDPTDAWPGLVPDRTDGAMSADDELFGIPGLKAPVV